MAMHAFIPFPLARLAFFHPIPTPSRRDSVWTAQQFLDSIRLSGSHIFCAVYHRVDFRASAWRQRDICRLRYHLIVYRSMWSTTWPKHAHTHRRTLLLDCQRRTRDKCVFMCTATSLYPFICRACVRRSRFPLSFTFLSLDAGTCFSFVVFVRY